jgi:hypothetical protein
MILDSAAAINVAGPKWRGILTDLTSDGSVVMGVGGAVMNSEGSGALTILFSSASHTISQSYIDGMCGRSPDAVKASSQGWCTATVGDVHPDDPPSTHLALWYNVFMPTVHVAKAVVESKEGSSARKRRPKSKSRAAAAEASRPTSRFPPLNASQLSERVGLTELVVQNHAADHYEGVTSRSRGHVDPVNEVVRGASMQRRRRHKSSTLASYRRSLLRTPGELWHWDLLPQMVPSPEGYISSMVFVEDCTWFYFLHPLRAKTTEHLLTGVRALMTFTKGRGRAVLELRGDFDPGFSVQGRGDDVDTRLLAAFRQETGIRTYTSPPLVQSLNRTEPMMGAIFAQMIINMVRAGFSSYAWWDMLGAAALQCNLRALPKGRRVGGSLKSRYELWHGIKYDLSRWIGYPGQGCHVSSGNKPNTCQSPGKAAYFIRPSERSGGFLIRVIDDMKAWHSFDVRMILGPNLRSARMMVHDKLNKQVHDVDVPQVQRTARLRQLYQHLPGELPNLNDMLAVVDPIDGMPLRLMPVFDPDTNEVTMLPENECELIEPSPPTTSPTPSPPTTSPSAWTTPSPGTRKNATAAFLRGLPSSSLISFDAEAVKIRKSKLRFEKYRTATTIAQLHRLNPKNFFLEDFKYDLAHGIVSIQGVQYDDVTQIYSFTPLSSPPVFRAVSPSHLDNIWNEVSAEDIDDASSVKANDDDDEYMDLIDVLKANLLAAPGDSSASVQRLKEVEALTHDDRFAALAELAKVEGTLAVLLALESTEGMDGPPVVSNASADSVIMDPLEVQDRMEGFEEVFFADGRVQTAPAPLPPAFAAQPILDEGNIKIKQALTSDKAAEFHAALGLDAHLMMDSGAIAICTYQCYLDAIEKYGSDMVDLRHIVYACKVKRNAKGEITKCKVRGCVADATRFGKVADTYSATVAPSSRRLLAQLMALHPEATSAQNDVRGAYYCGTPLHPDEGGRSLFCFIPDELVPFGFPQYDKDGNRNLIRIIGNIPGRQEAGKIWGEEYTRFLTNECGLIQSQVDRRLFYSHDENGKLFLVAVYVDDSWYISTSTLLETSFVTKWAAQYSTASDSSATEGEFCGIVIERKDDASVVLRGARLFDDLNAMLDGHPLPQGFTAEYPMSGNALHHMHAAPSDKNPLLDSRYQALARSVVGLGGFLACNVRPDAYPAFVAITQRLAHHFTLFVWKCILRWAHYLVLSRDLCLTYRAGTGPPQWCCYSDSALANLPDGGTFGGITFGLDAHSGLVDWRCFVPRCFPDSSAAAELIIATHASKTILGFRMLLQELRVLPDGPTPLYIDASAVIDGTEMEKITKQMRFMAARYSMLRQVVEVGKVRLQKCASLDNKSDGFTKPLVGQAFRHARSLVLGL